MNCAYLPPLLNHPTKILGLEVAHFFILASSISPIQLIAASPLITGFVLGLSYIFCLINDNLLPPQYFVLLGDKKNTIECAYQIKKVTNRASN